MQLEHAWYETSPYLYAAAGVAATLHRPGPLLMKASGILLLATALTIVALRWIYRRDAVQSGAIAIDRRDVALVTQDLFYDAASTDPFGSPPPRRR